MLQKIKELCRRRGVSIAELETACGLGPRTIYRWGEISPAVNKVKRVADYFDMTVDELIKEEG